MTVAAGVVAFPTSSVETVITLGVSQTYAYVATQILWASRVLLVLLGLDLIVRRGVVRWVAEQVGESVDEATELMPTSVLAVGVAYAVLMGAIIVASVPR